MSIRLAVILSGSLLVSAAGGLVAAWPAIRAADGASAPVYRAPTPELETDRRAVLASLDAARSDVAHRAGQLELLAALMVEAGAPSGEDAAPVAQPTVFEGRDDPVRALQ